ncbi:class I SAM-dependent methyltransferase [Kitasatospora sp. NPDC050543]|uniref:class I SAM-dependent methyltransferase n=1 Tax=Kitasatospora sp. NPDC050543 TaxID=3364054 RepID=UPI0037B5BE9F
MPVPSADPDSESPAVQSAPRRLDDVPGWFWPVDQLLFTRILDDQDPDAGAGDLLEMGTYLGRSAILIGRHLRPGETFTVCDLFDSEAPDDPNADEMSMSYRQTLTRKAFEANYLAFHPQLPQIVQATTSVLEGDRIAPESCRFVHIDASHLYDHVAGDIRVARAALRKNGVVALDDFRSEHTPGVSAAVWEAVFVHGLRPICLSTQKFYGTWGDPSEIQQALLQHDWTGEGWALEHETIAGRPVLRFGGAGVNPLEPPAPIEEPATEEPEKPQPPSEAQAPAASRSGPAPRSAARRLALDLLPPIATRAVRRRLQAARERRARSA